MDEIKEADCCRFCKYKESIMYDIHRCSEWKITVELYHVCGLFSRVD